MLAMADKNGVVEASIPGLADFARVETKDCESALEELSAPDPYSRTSDYDGRRVESIDGVGWKLLNFPKYRLKLNDDERREYNRKKQAEWREKNKPVKQKSKKVIDSQSLSALSAQAEADTEALCIEDEVVTSSSHPAVPSGNGKSPDFRQIESEIQTEWNALAEEFGFRPVKAWNEDRKKHLRARIRDAFWRDNWREAIRRVPLDPWNLGENERHWTATIDWFLRDKTVPALMEKTPQKPKSTIEGILI